MSTEFKSVNITGSAAADLGGGIPKRRTRRSKGGAAENQNDISYNDPMYKNASITKIHSGGTVLQVAPTTLPAAQLTAPPAAQLTTASAAPPAAPLTAPPTTQTIGGKKEPVNPIKVKLHKPHIVKKVTLKPKKEIAKEIPKTKKARKFVLGISSLHKRITRAKKVHHKIDKMPLDKLRKYLIDSKLIKPTSKAPEIILRQIAKDSQIVGKNVL